MKVKGQFSRVMDCTPHEFESWGRRNPGKKKVVSEGNVNLLHGGGFLTEDPQEKLSLIVGKGCAGDEDVVAGDQPQAEGDGAGLLERRKVEREVTSEPGSGQGAARSLLLHLLDREPF